MEIQHFEAEQKVCYILQFNYDMRINSVQARLTDGMKPKVYPILKEISAKIVT